MYCPGGNATDPIWRLLASSNGISSWTPLKPQHSNPNSNPNHLANQIWCSDSLTIPRGVMVKAIVCQTVAREFEFQSRYYVHFGTNTLGKGMNPLILPAMG